MSSGKITKGLFRASFSPKMDCAEGDTLTSQGTEGSSSAGCTAESCSNQRHKRAASEEEVLENQGTRSICPVCNLKHKLPKYYYAFPEIAPDCFQPREHL